VMARGNDRKQIFYGVDDYRLFLRTLEEAVAEHALKVYAYCLMPNHYHLLLGTPRGNLSQGAGWLQTTFTIRYNHKHGRSGHLFQGRFKALLIESSAYGRTVIPYVHFNPVRTRTEGKMRFRGTPEILCEWRWSSHRAYLGLEPAPSWLSLDWLGEWGKSLAQAREAYRNYVDLAFGGEVEDPFLQVKEGLYLGSEEFLRRVKRELSPDEGQEAKALMKELQRLDLTGKAEGLWKKEEDPRWQIWIRARLGGERKSDLAREYGYASGAGILEMVKRLEMAAVKQEEVRDKMERLRRSMGGTE